ncbi:hypothetical protein Scep_025310 [Stephania cephalantha]|uniref:Cytochrome P450 n=1 Tax=Stephania cephalantha TaxID=152367 RepID=A0AAP0HRF7_9MAGN
MKSDLENFWVLALIISKCTHDHPTLLLLLLLSLAFLLSAAIPRRATAIPSLPLLGHLHHFLTFLHPNLPLHRRLSALAHRHQSQRLMSLRIGATHIVVASRPGTAKDLLQSPAFVDRPFNECAHALMFHRAMGFAPHGPHWRFLRRVGSTHLFSPKHLARSVPYRSMIADRMVAYLSNQTADPARPVRVREMLKRGSLNHMMCCVFGGTDDCEPLMGLSSSGVWMDELVSMVDEGYDLLGKFNLADHFPWLAGLDLQRIRFRCSKLAPKVNRFLTRVLEQHRARPGSENDASFLHVLDSLDRPDKLPDQDLVALLWEMIFRGTDAVAVLIEWVLARMVIHADVQSKVHEELDRVVGKSRPVSESDLSSMVYLHAVIKEVLRLHPPGPLMSWCRLSIADTTIDGHDIPAGTTGIVNMWSIMRDPEVWSDPLTFKPERFMSKETEMEFSVFGSDLRIAPFGSGKRSCPGKFLGYATVNFWVASLLHEYEWGAPDQNPVDLSEVLRLSCEMANPLTAKVRRRR